MFRWIPTASLFEVKMLQKKSLSFGSAFCGQAKSLPFILSSGSTRPEFYILHARKTLSQSLWALLTLGSSFSTSLMGSAFSFGLMSGCFDNKLHSTCWMRDI
jgi:hypothetical protein